jgi:hypothetical protein
MPSLSILTYPIHKTNKSRPDSRIIYFLLSLHFSLSLSLVSIRYTRFQREKGKGKVQGNATSPTKCPSGVRSCGALQVRREQKAKPSESQRRPPMWQADSRRGKLTQVHCKREHAIVYRRKVKKQGRSDGGSASVSHRALFIPNPRRPPPPQVALSVSTDFTQSTKMETETHSGSRSTNHPHK